MKPHQEVMLLANVYWTSASSYGRSAYKNQATPRSAVKIPGITCCVDTGPGALHPTTSPQPYKAVLLVSGITCLHSRVHIINLYAAVTPEESRRLPRKYLSSRNPAWTFKSVPAKLISASSYPVVTAGVANRDKLWHEWQRFFLSSTLWAGY